jgi:hypothetical protein
MVYWLDTSSLTLVQNSWSDRYDFSSLKVLNKEHLFDFEEESGMPDLVEGLAYV